MDDNVSQEAELCEFLKWNIPKEITDIEKEGTETEECDKETSMLDDIFPPREWTRKIGEEDITYRQTVSREMSSEKTDMIAMAHQLDKYLQTYNTKQKGIDEIRSAILKLIFDEILRQVLVESEDLGAKLYRTYNEMRKIKYLWKIQCERDWDFSNLLTDPFEFDELEFQNKIESLTETNNGLTMKCAFAKLKYYNKLDAKMHNVRCLAISRKNYRLQKIHLANSTRILGDQLKFMSLPVNRMEQD